MEDGKGDSCPAGILRVTFYKQVFLFNHSQILVHFFTQDSISYMTKNVFFGELYCSLDDRLGELYCSERLLDQLCWVMILLVNRSVLLVNRSVLLLNFCMRLFFYKFICKLQRPIVGNITFALRSFLVFHLFMRNFGFNGYFPFLLGLTF